MKILGIGGLDHNGSLALVNNGKLSLFLELERLLRQKNIGISSEENLAFFLSYLNINEVDHIAIADQFWFRSQSKWLIPFLQYKFPNIPFSVYSHHDCHLASAFFSSPFEKATLISIDGKGDGFSTTAGIGQRGKPIQRLLEVKSSSSVGRLWWAVSEFCGFVGHHSAGKTMALAAYGRPVFLENLQKHLFLLPEGSFVLKPLEHSAKLFRSIPKLVSWFEECAKTPMSKGELKQEHKDMAATVQAITLQIVGHFVKKVIEKTGLRKVCLSGGVALNGLCNQHLLDSRIVEDIYVPPFTDDRGLSVGAAFIESIKTNIAIPPYPEGISPFMGPVPKTEIQDNSIFSQRIQGPKMWNTLVDLLTSGKIIAWYQGCDEAGPRALGNRSILASPVFHHMKDYLNQHIKKREPFRPFGCSILQEKANEWFEIEGTSPYMLRIVQVRETKKTQIPAVLHVDQTSRLHTVTADSAPQLYFLLKKLEEKGHPPLLLNTSLNSRGEPIAHRVEEALEIAQKINLDGILVADNLFFKLEQAKNSSNNTFLEKIRES